MVLSDYYDHFRQSSQYDFEFLKYFTCFFRARKQREAEEAAQQQRGGRSGAKAYGSRKQVTQMKIGENGQTVPTDKPASLCKCSTIMFCVIK